MNPSSAPAPGSTPGSNTSSIANAAAVVSTPAELIELVRAAIEQSTPIIDYGRAHADMGNPPPENHTRLDYRTDQPIIDHYDRDMTVRVHAGATLGQIQKALAASNQFVPIDADEDLAISEVINANVYGPLRVSLGGIRDLLLGLHYIDGQGRDIHPGGRTVKNVAGLDITKLMVGSLGELGLIHQATLRTYAIPQQVLSVDISLENPAALDDCLTTWLLTDACPAAMHLQHRPGQAHAWLLRIAYHGTAGACASQLDSLKTFIDMQPGMHIQGTLKDSLENDLTRNATGRQWQRSAAAVAKIVVPPASTGKVMAQLASQEHLTLEALPAHGCIFAGGDLAAEQTQTLDQAIEKIITHHHGLRSWVRLPRDSRQNIAPFAPLPASMALLSKLKTTMDPHHLFNPGRMIACSSNPA